MEKARLTREQSNALDEVLKIEDYANNYNLIISYHADRGMYWKLKEMNAMNDLTLDTLCRALYVGYEIIEEDQTIVVTDQRRRQARAFREVAMVEKGNNGKDGFLWAEGFDDALEYFGIKL